VEETTIVNLVSHAAVVAARHPIPEGEPYRVTTVHHGERSTSVVASIRPGFGLRPHFHREHDEVLVYLDGTAEFRLGDRVMTVRAGDVITVPAGVVHATLRAITPCLLAATFSPGFDIGAPDEDRIHVDD
jgi:quercetin dioxygenase-like cupin family protein